MCGGGCARDHHQQDALGHEARLSHRLAALLSTFFSAAPDHATGLTIDVMRIVCVAMIFAACDSGTTPAAPKDAAPDVAVIPVELLDSCPGGVAATVTDSSMAFIPKDTTIGVGQDVKFMITAEHIVIPNTLVNTDPSLNIGRGETKCFRFHKAGTYGFLCQVHGFTGTITVQ